MPCLLTLILTALPPYYQGPEWASMSALSIPNQIADIYPTGYAHSMPAPAQH